MSRKIHQSSYINRIIRRFNQESQSVFERKSETSLFSLNQKFCSMTKEPGGKIVAFIARTEEHIQRIRHLDVEIPDVMIITKVIMFLST